MSDSTLLSDQARDERVLAHLSGELLRVAERIQVEMRELPYGAITPEAMAQIETAEQVVDAKALDLQRGVGELVAWKQALANYETAWFKVIGSLGERKN